MRLDRELTRILDRAVDGVAPTRDECALCLRFPAESLEAAVLMAVADGVSRRRFGNRAILLGQIGIETAPCVGGCGFCIFGEGHTTVPSQRLSLEEITRRAREFTANEDLFALFLMTMHTYDFDWLVEVVHVVRQTIPRHTQIVVNIGDFDLSQARQLRSAGVSGAYHVRRLREGKDNRLDPDTRLRTIRAVREVGMDLYYCCEPVGPEHSAEELVEQMFTGIEEGCFQHAAMRRVAVPGTPLSRHGQITERRLAQVVAVVTLATLACPQTKNIAVHEPNLLGLAAGANVVYAESGANPRDTASDTAANRGLSVMDCREMLTEAGFGAVLRGDGTPLPLEFARP